MTLCIVDRLDARVALVFRIGAKPLLLAGMASLTVGLLLFSRDLGRRHLPQ